MTIAARLPAFARSRAVLIGTSQQTDSSLPSVPSIENNLTALAGLLTNDTLSGFTAEHCVAVSNPSTVEEVLSPLSVAAAAAEDLLFVYYAGHGVLVGDQMNLHLAMTDTRPADFWTSLDFSHIARVVRESGARTKVVILDCCYSGRAMLHVLSSSGTGVEQADIEGAYLLTSTSSTKRALAPENSTYTTFTGQLIEVLEGGLAAVGEVLPLTSVFDAVRLRMKRQGAPTPEQRNRNSAGHLALVRNRMHLASNTAVGTVKPLVQLVAPAEHPAPPISVIPLVADVFNVESHGDTKRSCPDPLDPVDDDLFDGSHEASVFGSRLVPNHMTPNAALAACSVDRTVVVGPPGSGKTTLLVSIAQYLTERAEHPIRAVHVQLSQYTGFSAGGDKQTFSVFVTEILRRELVIDVPRTQVCLLVDGLDELPTGLGAGSIRQDVLDFLAERHRWILTSRSKVNPADLRQCGFQELLLRELEPWQIHALLLAHGGQELGSDLWQRIGGSDIPDKPITSEEDAQTGARPLLDLCRNPYLAYMVIKLYRMEKATPTDRSDLLGRFALALLRQAVQRRQSGPKACSAGEVHNAMKALAYVANKQRRLSMADSAAVVALGDSRAAICLQCAVDAGILRLNNGRVSFAHRMLRDHFGSLAMKDAWDMRLSPVEFYPRDRWWARDFWDAALLLLAETSGAPDAVARWLAPAQPLRALQVAMMKPERSIADETRHAILVSCTDRLSDMHPASRATAARIIGDLESRMRPGTGIDLLGLPDIDWVPIPGTTAEISRYPTTNAQFESFVLADDGYREIGWPGKNGSPKPIAGRYTDDPAAPREMVNWHEAKAFARWMSLRTGREIRLPTEQEWLRAAQGSQSHPFPWGEWVPGICNTRASGIDRTSSVWIFPEGASECGAMDMSGNVWEWCLTAETCNAQPDANQHAPVRGGSWAGYTHHARTDFWTRFAPTTRLDEIGFRLVRSAQIPESRKEHS